MSVEENKQIVRGYIGGVINTGNVELIDEYISKDYFKIYVGKK